MTLFRHGTLKRLVVKAHYLFDVYILMSRLFWLELKSSVHNRICRPIMGCTDNFYATYNLTLMTYYLTLLVFKRKKWDLSKTGRVTWSYVCVCMELFISYGHCVANYIGSVRFGGSCYRSDERIYNFFFTIDQGLGSSRSTERCASRQNSKLQRLGSWWRNLS